MLWQRAIGDPDHKRIFCLLHAEKLSYQVCDRALRSLTELSQGQKQCEWLQQSILYFTFSFCPTHFNISFYSPQPFLPLPPSPHFTHLLISLYPTTTDYRLVIVCSNEDEDKSHIISRLNAHRKHFSTLHDVAKCREYLKIHFTGTTPTNKTTQKVASTVDCDG